MSENPDSHAAKVAQAIYERRRGYKPSNAWHHEGCAKDAEIIAAAIRAAVEAERAACAKVCEDENVTIDIATWQSLVDEMHASRKVVDAATEVVTNTSCLDGEQWVPAVRVLSEAIRAYESQKRATLSVWSMWRGERHA